MNSSGGLILMIGIGILVLGGIVAVNSLSDEAKQSNTTNAAVIAGTAEKITAPIFIVLGILVVLVGSFALLSAFQSI